MLQFIAKDDDRYSIPELVQMAIEGGCKWIQLHTPDATDAEIRELAQEVVPLCQETSTILTLENHLELAKELGVHGTLLVNSPVSPDEAREFCGPEAIIGIQVAEAIDVVPLKKKDIDYVVLTPDMPIDEVKKIIEAVRSAEIELPIVASGTYSIDSIPALKAAGVSGLALSTAISSADDPVKATEQIISLLS